MQPATPQPLSCPESVHAAPSPEPGLAAIIPAYNEGLVIGSVVLQARQHADRVIVVDDGSSDRTAAIARLAGADVIEMPENGGKAKAMMAGFARARDLGYEVVVMLDGDGQHDPDEIPVVAAPVLAGEADLVIGSRFLNSGADIPRYRVAGQKVLNGFTNLSTRVHGGDGFSTTDSQSGFRALGRRAAGLRRSSPERVVTWRGCVVTRPWRCSTPHPTRSSAWGSTNCCWPPA